MGTLKHLLPLQETGETKMKSFLSQKVWLAFGFAMLALLLMGLFSYRWMVVSDESDSQVRHTHEVLANIQDLALAMESIESATRGFVLTGKESDLDAYRANVSRVEQDQAAIRTLTADNPAQQVDFSHLESLVYERIQHTDMLINLRRTQGFAAAMAAIDSGPGEQDAEFQALVGKLQNEEARVRAQLIADTLRHSNQTKVILICGTLLGILVAGVAAWTAVRDSSKRASAAEAFQQSEERYRMLLDEVRDFATFMLDPQGTVISWSASAEHITGYTAEQIIGHNFSRFFVAGDIKRGRPEEVLRLAAASGRHDEYSMRVRRDGSQFPSGITFLALRDPSGNLRGFSEICRDLTEHKESEAKYRGLLEAAPDGMVVVDPYGEIVLLNAQAEKQFGYRRDELLGQKVTNIIPKGFAERLIADGTRTAAEALTQQIGTGIELHGLRKDGSLFPIEIMLSPLESSEGILVTAAIRDISERKQLARQLHQSQKMEAIGQLTGGIAHDFNNLLGVIIGNLDLLERLVTDNEPAVKRVQTAQKAAARGADITRRLLVFSSKEELKPSVVLLGDSIQNMIELAGHALGAEIKITTNADASVPPLFVDPAGLESALLNLVMNARDAMPEGGSIIISSHIQNLEDSHPAVQAGELKAGRYVCVSVTDTGSGMSRETLERAFEPFFTTKPRNKSTGLGLAMVYGFVKRSGGAVRAYSELGQGSTVSLYLPFVEDLSQPVPADAPQSLDAKLGGTVLVVDDEGDLLEVALAYLTEMGFTALDAKDGASALEVIAQHGEIDLMITDIVMPGGMNGVELVQRALALHPNLRIIYSSGFPAEALAERSMPLVDGPLLRKPYQRAEFSAIVDRVMKSNYAKPQGTLPFDRLFAGGSTGS
jgi:PAS domain S-box-containing protein